MDKIIDPKTPTDKRTTERKLFEKRAKEVVHYAVNEYGIWANLSIRDMTEFTNQFIYNVN